MQRAGILEAVDLLPQSHGDQIARIGRRRIAQNQDGTADAAAAELHGLLQIGDGKELRAQLTQMAADGHGTVAVGVGLDHAEEAAAGWDLRPELLVVMIQVVERNIRPGSL